MNHIPANTQPIQTPFCDKNYKILRVATQSVAVFGLAIIYKIISLSTLVFSKSTSHYFSDLAFYHLILSLRPTALHLYGGRVIDFSMNTTATIRSVDVQSGIVGMRDAYPNEWNDRWAVTDKLPLDQGNLVPRKMGEGCCLAMNLDLIARYLEKVASGLAPLEAMKQIAPLYANGATARAEIAHAFYAALLKSNTPDHETRNEKNIKVVAENLLALEASNAQSVNVTAEKMGLSIDHRLRIGFRAGALDFLKSVNELPENAYSVGLGTVFSGHAVVFIKTAGLCFLHDPNFATVVFSSKEEAASALWYLTNSYFTDNPFLECCSYIDYRTFIDCCSCTFAAVTQANQPAAAAAKIFLLS